MCSSYIDDSWDVITENANGSYLDFSVNTNFLGLPKAVKDNFNAITDVAGGYPDPKCKHLISCLSSKYNISSKYFLCGNGADDLLYRLIFATKPKRAVIVEPTFEEYERALELVNCEVFHYTLNEADNFTLDSGVLSVIQPDCDMLFICTPNNPTGQIVSTSLVEEILRCCVENDVLLVVDECFMEFLPEWRAHSAKELAAGTKNLIVIDAFTKTYSLAGFRLGFCVSGNIDLLEKMYLCGQSFAVSIPAQFAGVCALMDHAYMKTTYQTLLLEKEWLLTELNRFPLKVYPSQGNFLLLKSDTENILAKLLDKGIKVRDCSQFYGLSSEYFRIAIRKHSENKVLIEALTEIFL